MYTVKTALRFCVVALAAILLAAPLLSDRCLLTCHHRHSDPHRTRADQSCHHATANSGLGHRFQDHARPCGHDHHQTASLTTLGSSDARLTWTITADTIVSVASTSGTADHTIGSPRSTPFGTFRGGTGIPLPLRL